MTTDLALAALAWLGTYLVHSTLLLGAVALFARRMSSKKHPRLVERLWKVAAIGGLLTASVQVSLIQDPVLGRLSLRSMVAEAPPGAVRAPLRSPDSVAITADAGEGDVEPGARRTRRPRSGGYVRPRALDSGRVVDARTLEPAGYAGREAGFSRQPVTPRSPAGLAAGDSGSSRPDASSPVELTAAQGPAMAATPVPAARGPLGTEGLRGEAGSVLERAGKQLAWKPAVVATWAVIGGWGLFGFLFAWSRLFARLSDRRILRSGLLVDRLDELCKRAGVKKRIRLSASSSIDSPITHGWFLREICVPERALTELTPSQLETTLAHELAHVLRRDPLWFGIFALLERILFFQPLNRIARRDLQDIAEFVCDDWAVRWTSNRLALASALTEIAHWVVGRRQLALPSPGMASSRLGDRVERLLDDEHDIAPAPSRVWLQPTMLAALSLVTFAVPGVTSAAPGTPDEAPAVPAPAPGVAHDEEVAPALPHSPLGIRMDQELLDHELHLLQSELDALRRELDDTELYDRFEHALTAIERRMEDLRSRKERLNELLQRVLAEGENHHEETP